jgi:hypothetical protein
VPQDLHGDAWMNLERGEQRAACLASAVHGDLGNLSGDDAPIEAAVEISGLDRGSVARREDQAGVDPSLSGVGTVGVLLLPTDPECGDARSGQGKGCFRGLGLDLPADELMTDSLDLFSDIQFGGIQVHWLPGEPEYLTTAKAQDEDQNEGGVQRLSPYGAAAAAHGTPVIGRLRSPPYPAAAPASTTARPTYSRQARREP